MEVKKCLFILTYLESIEKNSSVLVELEYLFLNGNVKFYKILNEIEILQAGQVCIEMYGVYSSEII